MGVTHVFLGEIERGARPLPLERLADLVGAIPGLTETEVRNAMAHDRPVELDVRKAPPMYQRIALALARRFEDEDLKKQQLDELLELLNKK
jgi:hypothetical protein